MFYDIVIAVILIIFIIVGLKKGFISLYNRLLPLVGAVVLAAMLFATVSTAAMASPVGDTAVDLTGKALSSASEHFDRKLVGTGDGIVLVGEGEDVAFADALNLPAFLINSFESLVAADTPLDGTVTLGGALFPIVAKIVLDVLSCILLFVISLIVLLLLRKALQKLVVRIKALYWLDKIIGSVAWMVVGLFVVYLLLGLIQMFSFVPSIASAAETLTEGSTFIAGWLYSENLLLALLGRFFDVELVFAAVADLFS